MSLLRHLLSVLATALAAASAMAGDTSQLEQLRIEQFRLLAQVRYELRLAELQLQRTSQQDISLPQRRQSLAQLKRKFESVEQEIELEQRDEIVYVSSNSENSRVAAYYDALRSRIEDAGTKNFPQVNGHAARGAAAVLLELDLLGEVRRVEVVRSSTPELREHTEVLTPTEN